MVERDPGGAQMRLEGKVALIMRAASGIGRAGALLFGSEGAEVVVSGLDGEGGEKTASLVKARGGSATFVEADVTREKDCANMVRVALEQYGKLDIVWANAGVTHPFTPIDQISVDTFDNIVGVNAKGPWLTARQALPALRDNGGGSIVITASLSGLKARADLSAYQLSKGAAVMLTKSLAKELAPLNIRVNSVCPVAAETPMLPMLLGGASDEAIASAIPLGRLGKPEDMAYAALYLASDEASLVTGINLPVDGGALA